MTQAPHQRPGLMASHYRPLSDGDLRRIADAAFEVLEKKGMAVYSPIAFDALKAAGASADEETRTVKMPRSMVEDAVASNPSSIMQKKNAPSPLAN